MTREEFIEAAEAINKKHQEMSANKVFIKDKHNNFVKCIRLSNEKLEFLKKYTIKEYLNRQGDWNLRIPDSIIEVFEKFSWNFETLDPIIEEFERLKISENNGFSVQIYCQNPPHFKSHIKYIQENRQGLRADVFCRQDLIGQGFMLDFYSKFDNGMYQGRTELGGGLTILSIIQARQIAKKGLL